MQNNVCQGSTSYGFILPPVPCSAIASSPLSGNTAGTCRVGFSLTSFDQACQAFSSAAAYFCQNGLIGIPSGASTIAYSNFLLADNKLAISLRFNGF